MKCKIAKEIWDTLQAIYLIRRDGFKKKILIFNYMEFRIVDNEPITEQVQEFQLIPNKIDTYKICPNKNFYTDAIDSKFLPS